MNRGRGVWVLVIAASIAMIGAVVAGLFVLGTPAHQRALKLDSQRVADLAMIDMGIQNYWTQHHALPNDLDDAAINSDRSLDRITRRPYEYGRSNAASYSAASYSLCATFDLASEADRGGRRSFVGYVPYAGNWKHPAGHYCFQFLAGRGTGPIN